MKLFFLLLACAYAVTVSSQKQLKNGGFEKWEDTPGQMVPMHWSVQMIAALTHSPSDSAKEGNKALILSTWYSYVTGHLFYGDHINPDYRHWGDYTVPFSGRPAKLKGWYRYTHLVNPDDSAAGYILIKGENGDTIARGRVSFISAGNWSSFIIPLLYKSGGKANSIAVYFNSVEKSGGMNDDNYPNRLYLDGLKFVYRKE